MSMLENIEDTPCPKCGWKVLSFDFRLELNPIGASLAGMQLKMTGRFRPYIYCANLACDFEKWATIVGREIWVEM